MSIDISVIIVTKNEEGQIGACLKALQAFDDLWIVDSNSNDKTVAIAQNFQNAKIVNFTWNGQYPKKRQWCLDTLSLKYPWVLFIDADERLCASFIEEIRALALSSNETHAGFFLFGRYVFEDKPLRYGLKNNKCALIHKDRMCYPVIDDLDIEGMGEIEGHYQPVKRSGFETYKIGQIKTPILHYAYQDRDQWLERHENYAKWENEVRKRQALPMDVKPIRRLLKLVFEALPFKGTCAFLHCYILKRGFLDGAAGLRFARTRKQYYDMVARSQ